VEDVWTTIVLEASKACLVSVDCLAATEPSYSSLGPSRSLCRYTLLREDVAADALDREGFSAVHAPIEESGFV
jgi:hypothetical protein